MEKTSRKTGKPYYFNPETGESVWEKPAGFEGAGGSSGTVRCRHILRKHSGSRRPASWRNDNIIQSKEDAIGQIEAFREQVMAAMTEGFDAGQAKFVEIASTESDCSSAQRGGDLGQFGRGQMQKAFEDASYALDVGEVSPLVDSDSGIHIILRIE